MKKHPLNQHSFHQPRFATTGPIAASLPLLLVMGQAAQANVEQFPMPTTVAPNTQLKVDGDSSMKGVNAALKTQFESQFSGSSIELAESTSANAIQALKDGKIQLAAIGRPLTEAEKADGLVAVPIAFNKIGIITGKDNPFSRSLTNDQFAKIFRGEITDWSQVGGTAGPITFVDRPSTSDTRAAFNRYPVFQAAPFTTGSTAAKLDQDTTDAVIGKLGLSGIGYALAEQVMGRSDVKIIPLHQVLPDDKRYSFSQPLNYVYKGPNASPAVAAFLGLAQSDSTAPTIEEARKATVIGTLNDATATDKTAIAPMNAPVSEPVKVSESNPGAMATVPAADASGNTNPNLNWNWWWLLPLAGIPLLGAFLMKRRSPATNTSPPSTAEAISSSPATGVNLAGLGAAGAVAGLGAAGLGAAGLFGKSKTRLIVTPRNCKDAYAYWELDEAQAKQLRSQGGRDLALRIYDVTDDDLKRPERAQYHQVDCRDRSNDQHLRILHDDRDYITELGYVTENQDWLRLATSDVYHVPACVVNPVDTPVISPVQSSVADPVVHPVSHSVDDPVVNPATTVRQDPIDPPVAKAESSGLPGAGITGAGITGAAITGAAITGAGIAGAAGLAGAGLAGAAMAGSAGNHRDPHHHQHATILPETPTAHRSASHSDRDSDATHVILVPHDGRDAYVYWEISPADRERAIAAGGQQFVLRVGDVRGIPLEHNTRHSFRQYDLEENSHDRHVRLPVIDRDYVAEVGYLTRDQRWLGLARSTPVRMPALENPDSIPKSNAIVGDGSRIMILPAPPQRRIEEVGRPHPQAYVYWDIAESRRALLRRQGGNMLVLRIYDANHINLDEQAPHHTYEYMLDENARDITVPVPVGDRDYVAEIGYLTITGKFLSLGRSLYATIPELRMAN